MLEIRPEYDDDMFPFPSAFDHAFFDSHIWRLTEGIRSTVTALLALSLPAIEAAMSILSGCNVPETDETLNDPTFTARN